MSVSFGPIVRGLKSDIFKCKIRYIYVGFNCKRRSGVKNGWLKVCVCGGGGSDV